MTAAKYMEVKTESPMTITAPGSKEVKTEVKSAVAVAMSLENFEIERPLTESHKSSECFGREFSEEHVIVITLILNTLFALLQGFASLISKSLALLGDSISMAIDSVTYCLNWWAFRQKSRHPNVELTDKIEIGVSLFSSLTLIITCVYLLYESHKRLYDADHHAKIKEVRGDLLLGFALANLVIDIISICLFYHRRSSFYEPENDQITAIRTDEVTTEKKKTLNINFSAAFAHSLSDFLRTLSEIVSGVLVTVFDLDSIHTDAWCAIIVAIIIAIPSIYIFAISLRRNFNR